MKPLSNAERWEKEQILSNEEIDYLRRPHNTIGIPEREVVAIRERLFATIDHDRERIKELEENEEVYCCDCGEIVMTIPKKVLCRKCVVSVGIRI